jgi:hypothetical protein
MQVETHRSLVIGCGFTLAGVAFSYFLGGPFWAYACLFGGLCLVARGYLPEWFRRRSRRKIESVRAWVVAVLLIVGVSWLASVIHRRFVSQFGADKVVISLTPEQIVLPVHYHGDISFLTNDWGISLTHMFGPTEDPEQWWPSREFKDKTEFGYRCVVRNSGHETAFGVRITPVTVTSDGRLLATKIVVIDKPLGPGETFVFYTYNSFSRKKVEMNFPDEAAINLFMDGGQDSVPLKIIAGGNPLEMEPMIGK